MLLKLQVVSKNTLAEKFCLYQIKSTDLKSVAEHIYILVVNNVNPSSVKESNLRLYACTSRTCFFKANTSISWFFLVICILDKVFEAVARQMVSKCTLFNKQSWEYIYEGRSR